MNPLEHLILAQAIGVEDYEDDDEHDRDET